MATQGEKGLDDRTIERMLNAARDAATRAYAPYSTFPVGASVLTADGTIVAGCNIENASYGLTVCGERVAVFGALTEGHHQIRAVAVSAPRAAGTPPCGACRQVLNEFRPVDSDMVVLLDNGVGQRPETTLLSELLPHSFGPHDLKG